MQKNQSVKKSQPVCMFCAVLCCLAKGVYPLKQKLLICFHVFTFKSFLSLKVFILSNITIFEFALNLAICKKQARRSRYRTRENKQPWCELKRSENCLTRVPPWAKGEPCILYVSLSDQYTSLIRTLSIH